MKPSAPNLSIRRWESGHWSDSPDAVVTEEPLQLSLDGAPLSVVMRTPGSDVELALGLFYGEGILTSLQDVRVVRISAEAGEKVDGVVMEADLMESNQVDIHLAVAPLRRPERSMLSSSACGVCGAVMIEELVLTDAVGKPLAQLARDWVLNPIGMTNSTYEQPLPASREGQAARAHDRSGRQRRGDCCRRGPAALRGRAVIAGEERQGE